MANKIKRKLEEDNLTKIMLIFSLFYIICFFILEQRKVSVNIIHCVIDDMIPFCEIFIIPYLFWFVYMGAALFHFLFLCNQETERKRVIYSLCTGMIVFLLVSALYPNGHNLRPNTLPDNLFGVLVNILYKMDTSTNILPSLHVFETVAVSLALLRQDEFKGKKGFPAFIIISTLLIILSTLFLKQHSFVDVIFALVLNTLCYALFYTLPRLRNQYTYKTAVKKYCG